MISIHAVGYENVNVLDKAQDLAARLGFELSQHATPCVYVSQEGVFLKLPHFSLLGADFNAQSWAKRSAEGKKQGIVRACKPQKGMKVVDATAGWGRDAAILASLGAEMTLIERNPVMAALLEDALLRQSDEDRMKLKLNLYQGSAIKYLQDLDSMQYPDVIYIDPMHPERQKSALVKKDLQALQQLIGPDSDAQELIEFARTRVKGRVVVKWPGKVDALVLPDACISGKTVRFDLYFPKNSHQIKS